MVLSISYQKTCYVSCACNPTPHSVDWGKNGIISFGASNNVVLYKPEDDGGGRVVATLVGHKQRVNCTRWIKKSRNSNADETELISGSSDNTAAIWTIDKHGNYNQTAVLLGHENVVTVVDSICRTNNQGVEELIAVTASVDSTIKIWKRTNNDTACLKTIEVSASGLCLSVSITTIGEGGALLIACGNDDSKVTLYSESGNDFVKSSVLTGHDDWVRALDFTVTDEGDVMLASASQDATVRLWRFATTVTLNSSTEEGLQQERKTIVIGGKTLDIILEGVLSGHEGWVYGVCWHPPAPNEDGKLKQPMQLLTSSLDKTLILWAPEDDSGVWLESSRMGEMGGNGLGFYGACYGPGGNSLLVHGFQGGIHLWRKREDLWEPGVSITGHFGGVMDLAWEAIHGRYLLSISLDQTTRLHSPWKTKGSWHEIARPQIHGHDMTCIAALPDFQFVSGAEEKVIRAFKAPKNFLNNFEQLCSTYVTEDFQKSDTKESALGAAIPALGLSNRAVYSAEEVNRQPSEADKLSREQYSEAYFIPQNLKAPPTEDNLGQNTLWPEVMKLYGHGYELYSLAASHNGMLVASACKATSIEHASIILWDTKKWQKVQTLACHQLTITQIAFSPDDSHLISVSRDRCWSLFTKTGEMKYELLAKSDKKTGVHSRIIWCCAWTHDGDYFATGSRDSKVVMWETITQQDSTPLDLPGESITAVAFAPDFLPRPKVYLAAVGLESGEIKLYACTPQLEKCWQLHLTIDTSLAHVLTVKRLLFRPKSEKIGDDSEDRKNRHGTVFQLASCGLDHMVKVHNIFIRNSGL